MNKKLNREDNDHGYNLIDKKNRCVYTNKLGFETWYKYRGKRYIHAKDSEGDERIWKLNRRKQLTYFKDTHTSTEYWFKYNKNNDLIHYKFKCKDEIVNIGISYTDKNIIIKADNPHTVSVYDLNENLLYNETDKLKEWWEYDSKNRVIRYVNSNKIMYLTSYKRNGTIDRIDAVYDVTTNK